MAAILGTSLYQPPSIEGGGGGGRKNKDRKYTMKKVS